MTKFIVCIVASLLVAGCAGSPLKIVGDPKARQVTVEGIDYVVAPTASGFAATPKHHFATAISYVHTGELLSTQRGMRMAIETASGCTVTDYTVNPDAMTMQAAVRC